MALSQAVESGNRSSDELVPGRYDTFPLGSIKPVGWLRDQLELSAEGLAGHLFDFYRYVEKSTWLGGDYEYSELHESAPYWFNYIVPLAWTLDDDRLKAQAKYFLDYVLGHQQDDGWLGPEATRQTRGIWARSLLCFGLTQYAEADPTETDRIVDTMHRFVTLIHTMLQDNYTGLIEDKSQGDNFDPYSFGLMRTHELPISLMWLYDKHPRNNSQVIWETIELMFAGGQVGGKGDWTKWFVSGVFPTLGTPAIKTSGFTHGVNLAEGLRYPTVWYRQTRDTKLVEQTYTAVNLTATYQTSLSGTIIGDEHMGGLSPMRGSELCMSVESMFSYAFLHRFYGENDFGDRAERAALNALPAAISADWWSHQYVSQTNQPWSRNLTAQPYYNVVSYGNTFGLEPNFPCCTVNHGQGYPKYVASSYVRNGNNGIVHMLLGPTSLTTEISGRRVTITCRTNYPFSGTLNYNVKSDTDFTFSVRIPGWAMQDLAQASQQVDSGRLGPLSPDDTGLQNFSIKPGATTLTIKLPMPIWTVERNGSIGIYRGPLLYAADIQYNLTSHQPLNWTDRTPLPQSEVDPRSKDYVLEPTSEWQYAIDPESVTVEHLRSEDDDLPSPIWTRAAPPTVLRVDAYPVDWPEELGTAGLPPVDPVIDVTTKRRLKLIPYGAAKLHIAQFPVVHITTSD